jgi:hypothetical protein
VRPELLYGVSAWDIREFIRLGFLSGVWGRDIAEFEGGGVSCGIWEEGPSAGGVRGSARREGGDDAGARS